MSSTRQDKDKTNTMMSDSMRHPMTKKQSVFIRQLLKEREGHDVAERLRHALNSIRETPGISSTTASATIDELLKIQPTGRRSAGDQDLEDGMYEDQSGAIWKVYHTVRGANVQVAKELVRDGSSWEFVYRGRRPLYNLTEEDRMGIDQAKAFGKLYGICCQCSRALTDETSIANGIGPVCAEGFGA